MTLGRGARERPASPFHEEPDMAIPAAHRANFDTLLRAAADGNLALLECADAATGEPRYVLCAIGFDGAS
jgi:hypothetical protein